MMPALWIIFAMAFIVGPVLFLRLLRSRPSKTQFFKLGGIGFGATAGSFAVRYSSQSTDENAVSTIAVVGLIWLAWIAILAFVAQILRQQDPHSRRRRWTAVIGAVATTIPWFGLASARMMIF
jgi:hypothetical protein